MIIPLSYEKIHEFIQNEEGIVELLDNCTPIFEMIDEVNNELLNNEGLTFSDYDKITKQLTGCIMFLKPVSVKAEAYRHNIKHEKIVEFKRCGEKGMTDTAVKSRAEVAIKNYYHLVTVLDGYIARSYCGIKDCERQCINKKYEFKGLQRGENE